MVSGFLSKKQSQMREITELSETVVHPQDG